MRNDSKKKHRTCRRPVLCNCRWLHDHWWLFVLVSVEIQNPAGATQTVTTAETQPCSFVFVHRARLGAKTSLVIFALGLLVLRGQIFLLGGTLQTLTLTVEWITYESTHKGLNTADTAESKMFDYFIIIHRGRCLFHSYCSVESLGNTRASTRVCVTHRYTRNVLVFKLVDGFKYYSWKLM